MSRGSGGLGVVGQGLVGYRAGVKGTGSGGVKVWWGSRVSGGQGDGRG